MTENELLKLDIEKITFKGAGLARLNGEVVFVDDVIEGDNITAELISKKKNYSKAKLVEIVEKSPHRIEPNCRLANVCGGCQFQHASYEYQIHAKKGMIEDVMKTLYGKEIEVKEPIKSPKTTEYRCKIQLPIQQTKVSKRFLSGYYKKNSHDLVNIKFCPNHPEIVNEITEFIKQKALELGLMAYDEKKHKGLLRHVIYRYAHSSGDMLLIFVINEKTTPPELVELSHMVRKKFKAIKGVVANYNVQRTNVISSSEFKTIWGDDFIIENLDGNLYKISVGSFFQVNPYAAKNIFNTVKNIVKERLKSPSILDAYSGVGSFSIYLKDVASAIIAVEEYPQAVLDAKENVLLNKTENIEVIEGDCQKIFDEMVQNGQKFDCVIIDPPRKGATKETLESLAKLADKILIYVSCDPSTLARDMKILDEFGFKPEYIQPVDMFCHTYHVESVALLVKEKD